MKNKYKPQGSAWFPDSKFNRGENKDTHTRLVEPSNQQVQTGESRNSTGFTNNNSREPGEGEGEEGGGGGGGEL